MVGTMGLKGRFLAVMTLALAAVGCNGSDTTGSSTSSSGASASAAGIWVGTDSASGLALTGIIDSGGLADFIRSDGTQYIGTVQVTGTALAAALDVYTQFGTQFSDGSTYGVGTFNATVATASSLSGALSFTTSANNTVSSNWSLTFSDLYNNASSIADISGNYSDASTGDPLNGTTVSISGSGAMTAQSASSSCVLNGQISTANASNDAYQVSYMLENCAGADAVLNGIEFSGLALLNTGASPAQVVIGVRGQSSGGTNYGLVSGLTLN
jgi:hypothetical protein